MISLGTREYNLTDFEQELKTCPACKEKGIFISRSVHFFQFNSLPIFAKNSFANATCRKCKEQFKPDSNEQINQFLTEAISSIEVPKHLYIGAFLYPLAIGSAFAFFASFK